MKDLKWDGLELGITLDEYNLEPLTVEDEEAVHQSYRISLRDSEYTQLLINCDQEDVPGYLIDLQEDISIKHQKTIVPNTINIQYDFTTKQLLFECEDHDPSTDPISVHVSMRLADDNST